MEQLKNKCICYYCIGCTMEESENFIPKMNCSNFVQAYSNWQEKYYQALKEDQQ